MRGMRTNLRHLDTYRQVARLGSVSAAARAVHITQPAVTQALAGLERWFGAPLLLRRNTGVTLTPAGELCLVRIERALAQLREAMNEISRTGTDRAIDVGRVLRSSQLDALGAVVEYGNFSIAARARHLSQPSIHRAARALEREMHAAGVFAQRRVALARRNEQLVGPDVILSLAADRDAQHVEHRPVEALAGRDVLDNELHVIDEPSAMQFMGFHGATS